MLRGLLEIAPVAAGILAVPQFVPQLLVVRSGRALGGVSGAWATLTCVNNGAWAVYFVLSRYLLATISAAFVTLVAGALAVELARRGRLSGTGAGLTGVWGVLLTVLAIESGRVAMGAALAVAFPVQVAPSLFSAYRTRDPSGISRATWVLILGELTCYGCYGVRIGDPRLIALGAMGVVCSTLMLARTVW